MATLGNRNLETKQSNRAKNLDIESIAQELDLSEDFETSQNDEPKQFKRMSFK